MATAKVTYEKILQFRSNQVQYSQMHAQQFRPFLYALNKMFARTKKHEDEYLDKQRLINLEYAAKDEKGYAIMEKFTSEKRGEKKEEERFKFKVEDQKKLQEKQRELLNEEVEIECHVTTDIPDDLDFSWWSVFSPFILPEEPSDEQLEQLYQKTADKNKTKKE
jgi:hypothetical protein